MNAATQTNDPQIARTIREQRGRTMPRPRRETRSIRIGRIFGHSATIRYQLRANASDCTCPPATLHWQGRQIALGDDLDGRLARALPPAYLHAPADAWRVFISLAVSQGCL